MSKFLFRIILIILLVPFCGCAIVLQDSGLSAYSNVRGIAGISKGPQKTVFSVNDYKVTYWARLKFNVFGAQEYFDVIWIGPNNKPFLKTEEKTAGRTTNIIILSLHIKNHLPSMMPGPWKVEIYYKDQLLDEASFVIEDVL